ncbi:MAG: PKD domain-containing protein, partial [Cytophagales bacterium]
IALPADTLFTNEYKWFEPTKKYPVLVVKTQKVLGIEITQSIDYLDKKTYYQPTALYAFLPLTPIGGEEVVFQNLSINADKYLWNFGDPSAGPNNTSSEKNPSFIYSTPGTYLTTLTAFSGTITSSLSLPLTVFANSTILSTFSYSPSDSCSYSKTILFQNNSTPNASNYAWNFGDGTTSTLQNPLHIYTTSGLYKVKLRVSNPSETLIDSSFKIVKINDPVLIQGITPSATLCGGALAFMNVSASGSGLKYNWNNNNKNQGFYTSIPGKYFVTVTGNCSSRISNTSTLLFQPTTEILAQPASVTLTGGASTLIGVTAAGAQLTYLWNTNAKTNTILTSIAGSYIVTVSGACGQVVSNPALVTTVAGMVSPPKPVLTVIAFNASKVYGEENPIFSGNIIGLVTGDNVEVVFGLVGTSIVPTVTGTDLNKYNLYSLNGTLTIIRADQTVSIAGINTVTLSGLNQIVSIIGASNSGLPVSYFIQSNPMQIATISGNLIDVYKIGTITVTGIQNGNENYNQSLPTSTVFVVTTSMSGLISKVDLAFSETSINVFPNPNAGSFTIFVNNAADFKLLSIDGVEKTRGVLNVGENQISAPFPKGIYFLKVGSTIKKLIIN